MAGEQQPQRPAATPIRESDLGVGIDAFHPESKIPPGGLLDCLNGIARSNTAAVKRPGYRLAAGYVPVRCITFYQESTANGGQITLTFDSSISLANLVSTPILVVGRTSLSAGAFPQTGGAVYAAEFTVSGQTITLPYASAGTHQFPAGGAASSWATSGMEIDVYGLTLSSTAHPLGGPSPDLVSSDSTWVPGALRDFITPARSGLFLTVGGVPYITSAPTGNTTIFPAATTQQLAQIQSGTTVYLGPALFASAPTHAPARGTIVSSSVLSGSAGPAATVGFAPCTSATWNAANSTTVYRLNLPSYTASGALSSIIRALTDRLSVQGTSNAVLDGEFVVRSVTGIDANTIDVEVFNYANQTADNQLSDASLSALAGVFTDSTNLHSGLTSLMRAAEGAQLTFSDVTLDAADLVFKTSSAAFCAGPFTAVYAAPGSMTIGVKGSTSVFSLASTTGILRGDELLGPDGLLHVVKSINNQPDDTNVDAIISVTISGGTATATFSAPDSAKQIRVGDQLMLSAVSTLGAGVFAENGTGIITVTAVPSTTQIQWKSTAPASITSYNCFLIGHTVQVAPPVNLSRAGTFSVNRRWLAAPSAYDPTMSTQPATPITARPLQTPTDRGVTDASWSAHPSFAMVNKSLYLTDGLNPVKKFDGTTMYDAGLPNFAPLLSLTKRESSTGIVNPNTAANITSPITAYSFATDNPSLFAAGDVVYVGPRVIGATASVTSNQVVITPATGGSIAAGTPVQFWPSDAAGANTIGGLTTGVTYYLGTASLNGSGTTMYVYSNVLDAVNGNSGAAVSISSPAATVLITGRAVPPLTNDSGCTPIYTTVTSVNTTSGVVTVADEIDTSLYNNTTGLTPSTYKYAGTHWGVVVKAISLRYYAKLRMLDANGYLLGSAGIAAGDNVVRLGVTTEVQGVINNLPAMRDRQLARLSWEVYRTGGSDGTPPFYLVSTGAFDYTTTPTPATITFTDTVQLAQLTDATGTALGQTDFNSTLRSGVDAGAGFERPPLARHAASLSSQLALANIKSPHRMTITFRRRKSAPFIPTGQKLMRFVFANGTVAPSTLTTYSSSQLAFICGGMNSFSQVAATPVYHDATHNQLGSQTYSGPTYIYGTEYLREQLAASQTGWRIATSGQYPNANTAVTVTSMSGATMVAASGFSQFANGQLIYLASTTGGASYTPVTPYYLNVVSDTQAQLYANIGDAIAGTAAPILPNTSAPFVVVAGDLTRFPTQTINDSGAFPIVLDYGFANSQSSYTLARFRDASYDTLSGHPVSTTASAEQELANRLANAINAASALVATSTGKDPFVFARAGSDIGYASVQVEALDPSAPFTFTYLPLTTDGAIDCYVNGVRVNATVNASPVGPVAWTVTSQQQLFPSRIVLSYKNYAEIFHSPYAQSAADSDSAIDVSPDDGQEITAIRPLTTASVTGAAMQSQYLLAWKNKSAYLVDTVLKTVTKLITAGHGVDFRRATMEGWNGMLFTDHTGVHALTAANLYMYKGKMVERLFQENVNLSAPTDIWLGHHNVYRNLDLLAAPFLSDTDGAGNATTQGPQNVLVYDHTREADYFTALQPPPVGAWSRWNAVPMSCASGYLYDEYYGAWDTGQVYMERRDGLATDFRDRFDDAIQFTLTFRPLDCGAMSLRKEASALVISFRSEVATSGTTVSAAVDLSDQFVNCDAFEITAPVPPQTQGLSDVSGSAMKLFRFSLPNRKFTYLTVRITNSSVDEPVEISELALNVVPLTDAGITQAAKSGS
jgi:hypothetical protein